MRSNDRLTFPENASRGGGWKAPAQCSVAQKIHSESLMNLYELSCWKADISFPPEWRMSEH